MPTFYQKIEPIQHIVDITDASKYHDVPSDWYFALTDVRGSTVAIQQGRYKEVNALAVASIAAVFNAVHTHEMPFVFGGDGATLLIPPEAHEAVADALVATQQMAKDIFKFDLRIGIVPVADVLQAGYAVRVTRMAVSPQFRQAVFAGGGMAYAEDLLKDPVRGLAYVPISSSTAGADYSGFECRWQEVPSASDETISLIAQARQTDAYNTIYRDVLTQIESIYGDQEQRHPIRVGNLRMGWLPQAFRTEARVRYQDAGWRRLLRLARGTLMARVAMWFNIQGWGQYKHIFVTATDHEKFDGTLRMTISGTMRQREALQAYLEAQRTQGKLFYGLHHSRRALVTCIIQDYFGEQVHFVDGSDGGYALAALGMKAQIKEALAQAEQAV